MALQLDKRMLVLIVAIVVIVAAAAAYLLTRDGGDEAQGYKVTFEDFEDAAHPDVKIEITDSEGKVIADGKAAAHGETTFGLKITSKAEIKTAAPTTDRANIAFDDKVTPSSDGYIYIGKLTVKNGGDVTVGFKFEFGESMPDPEHTLTLTPYADPDKTGTKVVYEIDGTEVTGSVKLTEDTVVKVTVTTPNLMYALDVKLDPATAGTVSGVVINPVEGGSGFMGTATVTVKAGQDVSVSVDPSIFVNETTKGSLILIAPEGMSVTYGGYEYKNGARIVVEGDEDITINADEKATVNYVLSWGGTPGEVKTGTTVTVDIPSDNSQGTLRIGSYTGDAKSPGFEIKFGEGAEVYDVTGGQEAVKVTDDVYDRPTDLRVSFDTGDKSATKFCVYVAWEDGTTVCYSTNFGGSIIEGTASVTIEGLKWGHGDAVASVVPVYTDDKSEGAKIVVKAPEEVKVEYGGKVVGTDGFTPDATSDLAMTVGGAGTLEYTLTWGDGADARSISGTCIGFYAQKVILKIGPMVSDLGSATLTVTFTDEDGVKHVYEEPATPEDPDKGASSGTETGTTPSN